MRCLEVKPVEGARAAGWLAEPCSAVRVVPTAVEAAATVDGTVGRTAEGERRDYLCGVCGTILGDEDFCVLCSGPPAVRVPFEEAPPIRPLSDLLWPEPPEDHRTLEQMGIFVNVPSVHVTHNLLQKRGLVFCEVCGSFASFRVSKGLSDPCGAPPPPRRVVSKVAGKPSKFVAHWRFLALERLTKGLLPEGLDEWPLPAEKIPAGLLPGWPYKWATF